MGGQNVTSVYLVWAICNMGNMLHGQYVTCVYLIWAICNTRLF